jgi:cardiolipin synthase
VKRYRPARVPTGRRLRDQPWWLLLFAGIGVVATVTVLWALFMPHGRRPPPLAAPGLPEVTAPGFMEAVAGATNTSVHAGGTVELLDNGEGFFLPLLEAIGSARHSVTFLVYIWEDGEIGTQLFRALIDRARRGVQVRLLLDGFGGAMAPREHVEALTAAGGRVAYFRPPRFGMLTRYHRRNHRRAIVVDGRVGFTGGAAVGDKWRGNARTPDEWRDSMVRVTGPMAHSLQAVFAQSWTSTSGEVLVGPAFFPLEDVRAAAAGASIRYVSLASSPASEAHPLRLLFWLSFSAARRTLYLSSSYFVPDDHLRRAVSDRARAGVDVRLLLPGEHTDAKPIRWTSHGYYDELLSAGVRIFEYQPTFMHAKVLAVDGAWTVVGSANMDVRSHELNEENVLGILDGGLARAAEAAFLADLERSREIRLEEWRQRGWPARVRERLAGVFAEQY